MTTLKGAELSPINGVPGLFISDRFAARSIYPLKARNIQNILSITRMEDKPSFNTAMPISTMHIDIDDDPTEDLLCNLKPACDWIENSLSKQVGVLVHCTQGISRSGAVIVAYLMRTFSLSFPAALAKARETRPLISPNIGFEYQLRI